ncbi:hypothetical protein [Flavisolibacter ginsenosidimutans]|uniref:DUF4293 family protein n=1 Tax=Flavisolibacter ginsenosidimutans TaxID=661481 RepID=A0A5B8UI70_9BACT|nr:hypothetical protein [Flavisolibacter ginsenosidimutans]QEC56367.1 hypothetical protein FSB75_10855 [Flavisolibacter ginsenosidimutans]
MRLNVLLSLLVAALLVAACFMPWMTIESKGITITGVDTTGTTFGKPAYFHFFWAGLCLLFVLFNKVWSKRVTLLFAAFNVAWALRNFLLLPACAGGECPVRKLGLYLVLASSVLLFFAPLVERKPID